MILQLKITVDASSPTISRTIQVQDEMTFEQLDTIIQIVFDMDQMDSHIFHIHQSNGAKLHDAYIGIDFDNDFIIDEELILDEDQEQLADWLTKVKDHATYSLVGEEFDYHVVVEKILSSETSQEFPICIAAEGVILGLEEQMELVDSQYLMDEANAMLREMDFLFDGTDDEPDWDILFEAADELKKLKPWNYLADNEIFVVQDPVTSELLYCSVLGGAGHEFGLAVYVGDEGRAILEQLFEGNVTEDFYYSMCSLTVSYVDRNELADFDYKLIKDNGLSFRGKKNWIQFRSYEPGLFPWLPDAIDAMLLQTAIEQTIEMVQQVKEGLEIPFFEDPDMFLVRHIHEENDDFYWTLSVGKIARNDDILEEPLYLDLSEFEIAKLKKLPPTMQKIEFDIFYLREAVHDEDESDERPFYPIFVGAIDQNTGMLIFQNVANLRKDALAAQGLLLAFIQTANILPKILYVTKEMENYLAPLAKKLGIKLNSTQPLIEMEQFKEYMHSVF